MLQELWRNASSGEQTPQTERFYANPEKNTKFVRLKYFGVGSGWVVGFNCLFHIDGDI